MRWWNETKEQGTLDPTMGRKRRSIYKPEKQIVSNLVFTIYYFESYNYTTKQVQPLPPFYKKGTKPLEC